MYEIRIHGRGGQGGKTSSRVLGTAAFLSGKYVQDFPIYGAERRGAPVSDYVRISDEPILERGYIEEPDAIIVLDDALLNLISVKEGLKENGILLINSTKNIEGAKCVDATGIALRIIGKPIPSIAILGAFCKLQNIITLDALESAVRVEMEEHGISEDVIEKNILAARECYKAVK